jgi:hypothetical protein
MTEEKYVKTKAGVVVCKDDSARSSYLAQKKVAESRNAEVAGLQRQINTMSTELSEIKQLLTALINKDS